MNFLLCNPELKNDCGLHVYPHHFKPNKDYHQNIVKCAYDCLVRLKNESEILLVAETQSGKTQVMNRLTEIALKYKNKLKQEGIIIDNIFIFICCSSTELKKDIVKKTEDFGLKGCMEIYHLNEIANLFIPKLARQNARVLKAMSGNCLFIFDESHADAEKTQIINQFREKLGIPIGKELTNNRKIIYISATPYEQISAGFIPTIMEPGEGYYGFEKMIINDRIKQSILLNNQTNIVKIFTEIFNLHGKYPKKYMLIRLPKIKGNLTITDELKKYLRNVDYKTYDMTSKFDINMEYLDIKPQKFTIIFVFDKLRVGKSVHTENVCCLYDTPSNANTNTTAQSFAGRASGYNKESHNVLIYCDLEKIIEHNNWVKHKYDKEHLPKSNHVKYVDRKGDIMDKCIYSGNEYSKQMAKKNKKNDDIHIINENEKALEEFNKSNENFRKFFMELTNSNIKNQSNVQFKNCIFNLNN